MSTRLNDAHSTEDKLIDAMLEKLMGIQDKVDEINMDTMKQEFNMRADRHATMKDILQERDEITKDIDAFWETAILNSDFAYILFSMDSREKEEVEMPETGWIESIKVEYRPNFTYYVALQAKDNEYFENTTLEKEFSLFEINECKYTDINWKGKKVLDNSLIRFFSSDDSSDDDDNLSMFQILCDLYVNAVYYYVRSEEPETDTETKK